MILDTKIYIEYAGITDTGTSSKSLRRAAGNLTFLKTVASISAATLGSTATAYFTTVFGTEGITFTAHVEDGILMDADGMEVRFALEGACTRCLRPAQKTYTAAFAEEFSSAGEEDAYPYRSDKVDLTKAIDDLLILEMPLTFVCGEGCKAEYSDNKEKEV